MEVSLPCFRVGPPPSERVVWGHPVQLGPLPSISFRNTRSHIQRVRPPAPIVLWFCIFKASKGPNPRRPRTLYLPARCRYTSYLSGARPSPTWEAAKDRVNIVCHFFCGFPRITSAARLTRPPFFRVDFPLFLFRGKVGANFAPIGMRYAFGSHTISYEWNDFF